MIAVIAFCAASMAILALVSRSLDNARRLRRPAVDATELAAVFSTTNQIVEGTDTGDLADVLGDAYKGYTYEWIKTEISPQKLYEVDFHIFSQGQDKSLISAETNFFYSPQSPAGSQDGATVAR